jgi:hypothetical protein
MAARTTQVLRLAELAMRRASTGSCAPGRRSAMVKKAVEGRLLRRPRPAPRRRGTGDQKRVVTPGRRATTAPACWSSAARSAAPKTRSAAARAIEATL